METETEEETDQGGGGASAAAENEPNAGTKSKQVPSSGTKSKQAKKIAQASITNFVVPKPQTQKHSKSVSSLLCKTPEEVVAERHESKMSQPTLEYSTKSKEAKQIVDDHVADFFMRMEYH